MNYLAVLDLLLKYGPQAVVLAERLVAAVKAGKGDTEVSPEDWTFLATVGNQSATDIYAKLGITPPPAP